MSLNRFWSGFGPDNDWVFEEPFRGIRGRHPLVPFEETHTSRMMQPRMDLYENPNENRMTATFELPGLSKDKVSIDVQNGNLAVSGENTQSSDQQEHGYAVKERKFGRFVRTIRLPDGTKSKDIKATMENGILTVSYPKSSPSQDAQRISID